MRRMKRGAPRRKPSGARLKRRALNAAGALIGCSLLLIIAAPRTDMPAAVTAPSPSPSAAAVSAAAISIAEATPSVLLEPIQTAAPTPADWGGEPLILIYHTHTTEAYTPTEQYSYTASGDWRTHDNTMNIVAVGELLAQSLRDTYGIPVLHDTTDHEPPSLRSSYTRSLRTMLEYREKYPSLVLYIDVHRDSGTGPDYVTVNGANCARMMFVVGTGEGATGSGYSEMPDFEANYAMAEAVTSYLLALNNGLMRNIRVKSGRYNQHAASCCLLVEVGHNGNTLEEALASAKLLAEAIAAVLGQRQQGLTLTP